MRQQSAQQRQPTARQQPVPLQQSALAATAIAEPKTGSGEVNAAQAQQAQRRQAALAATAVGAPAAQPAIQMLAPAPPPALSSELTAQPPGVSPPPAPAKPPPLPAQPPALPEAPAVRASAAQAPAAGAKPPPLSGALGAGGQRDEPEQHTPPFVSIAPPQPKSAERRKWLMLSAAGGVTLILASLVGWLALSDGTPRAPEAATAPRAEAGSANAPQAPAPVEKPPALAADSAGSGASESATNAPKAAPSADDAKAAEPNQPEPPKAEPSSAVLAAASIGADGSDRAAPSCDVVLNHYAVQRTENKALVDRTLTHAEQALRFGNVKGAHAVYCKAIAMDPNSFRANLGLAQTLLIRRDAQAAAGWARKAVELDAGQQIVAKNLLGDALARTGNVSEARDLWYEAGPVPKPTADQLDLYMRKTQARAFSAYSKHDYHRAERLYRRVLIFEPDNEVARRRLISTLRRLKEFQAAAYWASGQ